MTRKELLQVAKPILFNTEMVRAILDNRKSVTRRVVKEENLADCEFVSMKENPIICYKNDEKNNIQLKGLYATFVREFNNKDIGGVSISSIEFPAIKSPYQKGDVLYVRETWAEKPVEIGGGHIYKADVKLRDVYVWKPSIHMPKEAARIFLRVTDVGVERLWDITEEQALKEGCGDYVSAIGGFAYVWNSTIKKADLDTYGWNANPWVWVIEFERVEEG